jgi:ABC-type uncharacterized transport system substrate-binding protein
LSRFRGTFHSFDPVGFAIFAISGKCVQLIRFILSQLISSSWFRFLVLVIAFVKHALIDLSGGLVSYGIDQMEQMSGGASYVDRVLRGENPGELPVQLPTKYELAINLKTAKALGLKIPESLLFRADEVIE